MSDSREEQLQARLHALLLGANIADVGENVFRSRVEPIEKNLAPAIVVEPAQLSANPLGDEADDNTFEIDVVTVVRGDPWPLLADPPAVAAHALILADAASGAAGALGSIAARVRRIGALWHHDQADATAGVKVTRYQFRFLTHARDLTRAP
jgi:hypothetical protein